MATYTPASFAFSNPSGYGTIDDVLNRARGMQNYVPRRSVAPEVYSNEGRNSVSTAVQPTARVSKPRVVQSAQAPTTLANVSTNQPSPQGFGSAEIGSVPITNPVSTNTPFQAVTTPKLGFDYQQMVNDYTGDTEYGQFNQPTKPYAFDYQPTNRRDGVVDFSIGTKAGSSIGDSLSKWWEKDWGNTTDIKTGITTTGKLSDIGTIGSGLLQGLDAYNKYQAGQLARENFEFNKAVANKQLAANRLALSDNLARNAGNRMAGDINYGNLSATDAYSRGRTQAAEELSKYGV